MVSFIIRTKNEEKEIENTLKAIRKQDTTEEIEVILIDSGSQDNTINIAKKYVDKIIEISEEDFSWGYALNLGIEQSEGEFICIISGHCILVSDKTIENAINILKNRDIVALYGMQKGRKEKDVFEVNELCKDYPINEYYEYGLDELESGKNIGVSNACCLLKKSIWKNYKYNEEVQSAEDGYWAYEVCENNYRLAYSSKFAVYHGHNFNISYIYKKWYWRIFYVNQIKKNNMTLRRSRLYFILKFLVAKPMIDTMRYQNNFKKINVKISITDNLLFHIIKGIAIYNAFIDLKKIIGNKQKYEELRIPKIVLQLQKYIKYSV